MAPFSSVTLPGRRTGLDFTALFHGVDERVPVDALEFGGGSRGSGTVLVDLNGLTVEMTGAAFDLVKDAAQGDLDPEEIASHLVVRNDWQRPGC